MQVQHSIRKKVWFVKHAVIAVVFLFIAAAGWFARPWLRERWYDYRDAQMRVEVPEAVGYKEQGTVPDGVPDGPSWRRPRTSERRPRSKEQVMITTTPTVILEEPAAGDDMIQPNVIPETRSVIRDPVDSIAATTSRLQNDKKVEAVNLRIPFVSQAPHRNWSLPYQEACEEASAIMASLYYQGDTRDMVIGDAGDALLQKTIAWENERFGDYKDTTVAETVVMLEEYFKLRARIVEDPTVEQIKEAVAAGKPVIVPAYGKILPNPYFKNGGPLYHMLIVKGYTDKKFITNDPGTNTRGADFTYTYDALMNAMHDWNGGDVPHGAKRIIVVAGPLV